MAYSHQSWFAYQLNRPYPFTWFTPVVLAGFILFTVLFSFLNFVSTGYTLVVQESSNPNATVSSGVWMRHWPSFLTTKIQPTCQTINLPVGSEFFTNQTALTYTVTDVWQPQAGGAGAGYGIAPSLTYYNNLLENCSVNSIEIDLAAMDRSANQFAYSEWGAVVRSYATCSIVGANGTTNFNLTQEYDYVPPTISFANLYQFLGTNFLTRSQSDRASLYWGESLMSMYWAYTTRSMQNIRANQTANNEPGIRKGTLYFYINDDRHIAELTDLAFFEIDFRFVIDKGQGDFDILFPGTYGEYTDYTNLATLIAEESYPNIWAQADVLAKVAYSTVLADLGQLSLPNLLTSPDSLSYFTANFSEARRNIANAYPGPATTAYGTAGTGPLGVTPSVIATKYLCQVPQRKSSGNLFVAILVADLVLLQALWTLFKLLVDHFCLAPRPGAQNCEGCCAESCCGEGLGTGYGGVTPGLGGQGKGQAGGEGEGAVEMKGFRTGKTSVAASSLRSWDERRLIGGNESLDLGYRR